MLRTLLAMLLAALAGAALAGEPATFTVVMKDGRFAPPRLKVPAGKRIKLVIRNEGSGPAEFESAELRVEKVLVAGASSFVVIHRLRPGTYRFVDDFRPSGPGMLVIAK